MAFSMLQHEATPPGGTAGSAPESEGRFKSAGGVAHEPCRRMPSPSLARRSQHCGGDVRSIPPVPHQYPTPTGSASMTAVSLYSPFSRIRKALQERSCEAPRGIMHLCESMHFHLPANGRGMKSLR
ncbi:unnamed protein product [Arctogadus glacialis]